MACEPVVARDGITMRTIEDVRVEAIVRGVAEDISWSSVQRILSEGEIRPHLVQGQHTDSYHDLLHAADVVEGRPARGRDSQKNTMAKARATSAAHRNIDP